MNVAPHDLTPFEPVEDELILAAVDRAQRHRQASEVWVGVVSEHLGFLPVGHTTRKLRDQLERLRIAGFLAHSERQMREQWSLTSAGQEELARLQAAGRVGDLPESPQHRDWRLARVDARRRSNEFRGYLNRATQEADDMAAAARVFPSRRWFEVGDRLRAAHWLVGAVTHCLEEWDEPDDARPDNDPEPNLAPGRRAISLWPEKAREANGGQHDE